MGLNIGFISTRFSGIDGVSLEAAKWAEVFEREGHNCFWFAGELDRHPYRSYKAAMAHFRHPQVKKLNDAFFETDHLENALFQDFRSISDILVKQLHTFIETFRISTLIAENALSIPMNIPLAMAITRVIRDTGLPTIAHHHDFSWERRRFLVNGSSQLIHKHFPPNLPSIQHVVINTDAKKRLKEKTGIDAEIVPNVMDFENTHVNKTQATNRFREKLGLVPRDRIVLQPTRIVPRKGIELAIDLVHGLSDDRFKLVVSHPSGDEGNGYCKIIRDYAEKKHVDFRLVDFEIDSPWSRNENDRPYLSLWDVYPAAELVTLPSLIEGFGNAFLEAVWFRKPILVNRYEVYLQDIRPIGFNCVEIDGTVTPSAIEQVKTLMASPSRVANMVETNYALAKQHFSYRALRSLMHGVN
jgi:glycosyltransferase involved in cell wall biosynthesis